MQHYRDNVSTFDETYEKSNVTDKNTVNKQSVSFYFFDIAMAITKKHALHLVH